MKKLIQQITGKGSKSQAELLTKVHLMAFKYDNQSPVVLQNGIVHEMSPAKGDLSGTVQIGVGDVRTITMKYDSQRGC